MQFTAAQIAQLLQGTVEGDANATVARLSKIEEGGPGSLSFLANPAYTQHVYTTTASVVIIGKDFALTAPVKTTLVRVADAQGAFAKVLEMYNFFNDAATAEISRSQIWQQLHFGATLDDGQTVTPELFDRLLGEEMERVKGEIGPDNYAAGRFPEAIEIFRTLSTADTLSPFLTLPAYRMIV